MEALWHAGGPSPGYDYDFSGQGKYEQLLAAMHGRNPRDRALADYRECVTEQRQRPHCFVRKLPGRAVKPFRLDRTAPRPTLISIEDFASQYAAAQYAACSGLWCDTSLTIKWCLLDINDAAAVKKAFRRFKEKINEWLADAKIPAAYFYAHECGQDDGLHTHLQVYIPGDSEVVWWEGEGRKANGLRKKFRHWAKQTWVKSKCGKHVPNAVHVNGHNKLCRNRHWIGFHYQLKGYDLDAVVMRSYNSTDKQSIMLGDLVAFSWRNPGVVTDMPRVGYSRSLGPKSRSAGLPNERGELPKVIDRTFKLSGRMIELPEPTWQPERHPFQSRYEAGWRSVWALYDLDFCQSVTRLTWEQATSVNSSSNSDLAREREKATENLMNMTLL